MTTLRDPADIAWQLRGEDGELVPWPSVFTDEVKAHVRTVLRLEAAEATIAALRERLARQDAVVEAAREVDTAFRRVTGVYPQQGHIRALRAALEALPETSE